MPLKLTDFDKKIGNKIRNYRILNDIPQEKLGEYLKLPKQAISRMENGKRRITPEELEKTALFFDEPIQMFLRDEYIYTYPQETDYGNFPVFMSYFLDLYERALTINAGKNNVADKYTNKFINVIKQINSYVKDQLKTNEAKFRIYIENKEKHCKRLFI